MWMGSGSLSTSGFVKWYTVVEPSLVPPADSLGRHRSDETVETERLRDTPRVAGFSTVSDTTTERTGSNTRMIAFTDCAYGLWKMATVQTTLEGVKGVKHPLVLSPRKHATRHTEHRFTAIGKHECHDGRPKTSGSHGSAPAPDNSAKNRWLGPRDARMRSHLRPRRHLRAKQARERISHAGSLHAAPQHTPGASLAVLNAPRRVGIDSRQDDVLTPWGWRASHSVDAAPVFIGALGVTYGAAAHLKVSTK
jgi:hypothetical protein